MEKIPEIVGSERLGCQTFETRTDYGGLHEKVSNPREGLKARRTSQGKGKVSKLLVYKWAPTRNLQFR